jgi:hypothetical protein
VATPDFTGGQGNLYYFTLLALSREEKIDEEKIEM